MYRKIKEHHTYVYSPKVETSIEQMLELPGSSPLSAVLLLLPAREISVIDHSCIIKLRARFHYVASCRKERKNIHHQQRHHYAQQHRHHDVRQQHHRQWQLADQQVACVSAYERILNFTTLRGLHIQHRATDNALRWWCGQYWQWWWLATAHVADGGFLLSTCSTFARSSHLCTVVFSRRIQ